MLRLEDLLFRELTQRGYRGGWYFDTCSIRSRPAPSIRLRYRDHGNTIAGPERGYAATPSGFLTVEKATFSCRLVHLYARLADSRPLFGNQLSGAL